MPKINLLPWREEQRRQKQNAFIQISALIGLVTLLIITAAGQLINYRIDAQNERNQLIQSQINILNTEIKEVRALQKKRDQLLSWIGVVQNLQHNRSDIVRIMNAVTLATSSQLYLTRLQLEGRTLTLEGEAADNRQISNLMRNLSPAKILANPTLTDVSASTTNDGFNRFALKVEYQKTAPHPIEESQ